MRDVIGQKNELGTWLRKTLQGNAQIIGKRDYFSLLGRIEMRTKSWNTTGKDGEWDTFVGFTICTV